MERLEALTAYYSRGKEDGRLLSRYGSVEFITTVHYIEKYLCPGMEILEIGAGTGRYSHYFARNGYEVDAVELMECNIEVFKAHTLPSEKITVAQGDALDLEIEDEQYDITLLLGPMYHLYTREDKVRALSEAMRVTKPGGSVLVAYCMNEATVIQYVFGCNKLREIMDLHMLTEDWKCISEPKDLFEMVRTEDIERINAAVSVERVKLVATDGASRYIREYLEEMDEETFEKWLSYHFATCERQDLIGATNHSLDILRKV